MLSNEKEVDMADYTDSIYGELIADQYDTLYSDIDPNLVDRLLELSSGGKTLELGIGTGRIAIPLSNRGVAIHGIDASPAMLEKLQSKGKGRSIPVRICLNRDPKMRAITVSSSPSSKSFYEEIGFKAQGEEVDECGMHFTPMQKTVD
jgi:SAM-dependent methyltransferase